MEGLTNRITQYYLRENMKYRKSRIGYQAERHNINMKIVISKQAVMRLSPFTTTEHHPLPFSAFVHRDNPQPPSLLHSLPLMTTATSHIPHIKVKSKRQPFSISATSEKYMHKTHKLYMRATGRKRDRRTSPAQGSQASPTRVRPILSPYVAPQIPKKFGSSLAGKGVMGISPLAAGYLLRTCPVRMDGGARLTPAPDDRDNLLPSSITPPDRRAHFPGEAVLNIDCQMPDD